MKPKRLVRRALDEIPNHLSKLESSQATQQWIELWADPIWILAKLATSGVTHVCQSIANSFEKRKKK